jgi:hypothetical protein
MVSQVAKENVESNQVLLPVAVSGLRASAHR